MHESCSKSDTQILNINNNLYNFLLNTFETTLIALLKVLGMVHILFSLYQVELLAISNLIQLNFARKTGLVTDLRNLTCKSVLMFSVFVIIHISLSFGANYSEVRK